MMIRVVRDRYGEVYVHDSREYIYSGKGYADLRYRGIMRWDNGRVLMLTTRDYRWRLL